MSYKIFSLRNGLRCVYRHNNSPVSCCSLTIDSGSANESENEHGLAHFIEHCLFKGTKNRKAIDIISSMDEVGGELNAYTSKDETCIYSVFLNEYSERAIDLIADVTTNSTFPENEIKKEKEIVLDEINSYKDNPSEMIFDDFEENLFQGSPLSHPILGNIESVKKFSKKDIANFIMKNYTPDRMVFCYIGKENMDTVQYWAEHYFESLSGIVKKQEPNEFLYRPPFNIKKNEDIYQSYCIIGNTAFDFKDKKKTAMLLLNNILGGPAMNSLLNIRLREKEGICYNIESHYTPYQTTGVFSIFFGTDKKNIDKSISLILDELKKVREKKFSDEKLELFKVQLKGQITISIQNTVNEMLSLGKSLLIYNKIDSLNEINRKIDSITSENILEVAEIVLCETKLNTMIYIGN